MKQLILHIGMHKTGTTALQETLHAARRDLVSHGINYLDMGANHSQPLFSIFGEKLTAYRANLKAGLDTKEAIASYASDAKARLQRLLSENTAPVTIISAEDLSLLRRPAVPKLRDFLSPYFDSILVVAYVRRPVSFINSLAVQAVKGGATLKALHENPPSPDYQWRFNKFLQAFGEQQMRLRLYDPATLKAGSVVTDFFELASLPHSALPTADEPILNKSLSAPAVNFLSETNKRTPMYIDDKLNPARPAGLIEEAATMAGDPFSLPEELIEATLKANDWDIGWMEKKLGTTLR